VTYTFTGFLAPVQMGVLNAANAGRTIPIKWQLSDASGGYISALSAAKDVSSAALPCGGGTTTDVRPAHTSGASGLRYDGTAHQDIYTWQTERTWAGTCRRFTLTLDDGTVETADFQFR
jgi:hypothetical protein